MLNNRSVAVIVPAYNEESQIGMVLETMPDFVDRVIVINDCSKDKTESVVKDYIKNDKRTPTTLYLPEKIIPNRYNKADILLADMTQSQNEKSVPYETYADPNSRIVLISHRKNGGKGESIKTGYLWCRNNHIFCSVIMDGDGQMDPSELESICKPVVERDIDYVKANRLTHRSALFVIPKLRFFGNSVLSLLTKIASGYWHVSDSQTGYTAISYNALCALNIPKIYSKYGVPNDVLIKLNIAFCTITEVPSKPVYHVGEKSKMNELKVVPKISWLLFKGFWQRLYQKYLFRDFHPLFILYHFSLIMLVSSIFPFIKTIQSLGSNINVSSTSTPYFLLFILMFASGFQSLLFAMWMDMQDNERLQK